MLSRRAASHLVVIDTQEKLCAAMPAEALPEVTRNCEVLLQAARLLEVPVTHTEQYPRGLGSTIAVLQPWLTAPAIEKTCFSCCDESAFRARLHSDRPQMVLAGMEAHICVLQTALQLQDSGRQVIVAEDAVLSRRPASKENAMTRLRQAGVIVACTESIVFEWLQTAQGEAFKQISKLIR